jgi:N12 class adenine-specific DNA methylase
MPTKLETITALYDQTLASMTKSPRQWTAFLSSACMNYKLPFEEQLLVYAQRPDATAVLELEKWNGIFNRWVNRGAKGIAVLSDESASCLKHYFDISDTHEGKHSLPVPTWQMRPEYGQDVIEALEAAFGGLAERGGLDVAIMSAAANAAEDNFADYLDDLLMVVGDTGTEPAAMLSVLRSSVAFMALERCGIDPWALLSGEDFAGLDAFTEPAAATIIGTAVADTAKMALREIAATVLSQEHGALRIRTIAPGPEPVHTEPIEESDDNGRLERPVDVQGSSEPASATTELANAKDDLLEKTDGRNRDGADIQRDRAGIPAAGFGRADGDHLRHRDVGPQTQEVPEGASPGGIRGDEDARDAVLAPVRDKQAGRGDVGTVGRANGEGAESERRDEDARSDGVGGQDERHPQPGGRDGDKRPGLLLGRPPGTPARDRPEEGAVGERPAAPSASEDRYKIPLGTAVYIGTQQYDLLSLDDGQATLYDPTSPLFPRVMDAEEFYRRLAENPLNDHLKGAVAPGASKSEPTAQPEQVKEQLSEEKKPAASKPVSASTSATPAPPQERRDFIITDDALGHGGTKQRAHWNLDAIRLAQQLEDEGRQADAGEQSVLSRYVGWGAIPQVFDEANSDFATERADLRFLLTDEDYAAARASTINAYYTSPVVIKAIYAAIEGMGFRAGNVLEPSCGIGNFLGLVPESMAASRFYGVEIDPMTAAIAKQLYQRADIRCESFEASGFPDSFFDVAVGNVPFGNYQIADKRYDRYSFLVHDYFFAKTLDKVRPGGIVAFVTSKGTLDKRNPAVRRYLAERAELIGAIRLPNNAFKDNAGTEVTADIIFLQKRDCPAVAEPAWVHLGQMPDGIAVNSYFADNPEMVLGRMTHDGRQYGRADDTTCEPYPGADLAEQLTGAIANIHAVIADYERDEEAEADNSIPADPEVRNFSYTVASGRVYFREDSKMYPQELSDTATSRVKGLIQIRESVRSLIQLQTEDATDAEVTSAQRDLTRAYDRYTAKYDLITSRGNQMAFGKDSSYPLLASLENIDEDGKLVSRAAMFTKRTIRPYAAPTRADTPAEALAVSLAERAKVDLPFMANLVGMAEHEIATELKGIVFKVPGSDFVHPEYQTADEYLSGNVRDKLRHAEWGAAGDPELAVNVEALNAALPEDLTASEINVRLGATWIPTADIQDFIFELLQPPRYQRHNITVHYAPVTAQWSIRGKGADKGNPLARATFGTHRKSAYEIVEDTLNLRDVRVNDRVDDGEGGYKYVLNKRETAIACAKQDAIKAKFSEWIWSDLKRRERLCRHYNDTFNSMRLRTFSGEHISFPGMNPEIRLNGHQKNAVARILYGGNTLLAHVVGAGKTYTMAAAAQEMRRLKLSNKPLIVVPNHLTEQWASEYLQLYPAANILVATRRDFERKNRRRFCARIATGDYDAVIIGHSQFEKIPMSIEHQTEAMQSEIDDVVLGIAQMKAERGDRMTIKQMETAKRRLEARLKKLNDQSRKDDVITFEELGVDRLFIDESHFYKNLFMFTKMRNVGGVAQSEAQKSSDLFMKCRYLDDKTGGKGVVFATGTPISNSMVELYTVQRYLQYNELQHLALTHFDCWASTFGETVSAIELSPEGSGYRQKTRFSKFYNLPELMCLFRQAADIQTADMLDLPVPEVDYHNISVAPTEMQREMVAELGARADRVRNRMVSPAKDNMLLVTGDGRKLALDQRLINPMLPDSPTSKVSVCCENVFQLWKHHQDTRQAQLIFCDMSTPKGDGSFNVYDDIKKKLIAKGVPPEEVAFIHDANTEARKAELFAKVRSGAVRVLIGSTPKMGAGTNVQERLVAIHDLDCPWRPSDLEQRRGRIVRQGNTNERVEVYRYVTENTFDSYLWQMVEGKQRFIGQIMTSKSPVRSAEDVDEQALSYAEIKALATGNPLIKERMDLDIEVARLKMLKADFLSQRYTLEDNVIKHYPQQIKILEERIVGYEGDIITVKTNKPADKEHFSMAVGSATYRERKEAGEAVLAAAEKLSSPKPVSLGKYAGFDMELSFDTVSREFRCAIVGRLRHTVVLGTDALGNITRIDNALDLLQSSCESCREQLGNIRNQMDNAKGEAIKPFEKDRELTEKSARLAELDALLNMGEKASEVLDAGDEDKDELDLKPAKERGGGQER